MLLDNYEVDPLASSPVIAVHPIAFTPIRYDKQYISYYEDLSDRTIKLGYQRLGLLGLLGEIPRSVLEIGYGTGSFNIEAAEIGSDADCADYDITQLSASSPALTSRMWLGRPCCRCAGRNRDRAPPTLLDIPRPADAAALAIERRLKTAPSVDLIAPADDIAACFRCLRMACPASSPFNRESLEPLVGPRRTDSTSLEIADLDTLAAA